MNSQTLKSTFLALSLLISIRAFAHPDKTMPIKYLQKGTVFVLTAPVNFPPSTELGESTAYRSKDSMTINPISCSFILEKPATYDRFIDSGARLVVVSAVRANPYFVSIDTHIEDSGTPVGIFCSIYTTVDYDAQLESLLLALGSAVKIEFPEPVQVK